jgi:hypothetical protein
MSALPPSETPVSDLPSVHSANHSLPSCATAALAKWKPVLPDRDGRYLAMVAAGFPIEKSPMMVDSPLWLSSGRARPGKSDGMPPQPSQVSAGESGPASGRTQGVFTRHAASHDRLHPVSVQPQTSPARPVITSARSPPLLRPTTPTWRRPLASAAGTSMRLFFWTHSGGLSRPAWHTVVWH